MSTYSMTVAGLQRELPICKVTDDLYIGAFICFGDAELTEACGRELLKLLEPGSYDYLFTAEAKSIPLIHEMARQSGRQNSKLLELGLMKNDQLLPFLKYKRTATKRDYKQLPHRILPKSKDEVYSPSLQRIEHRTCLPLYC